jgi:hypothetical protein
MSQWCVQVAGALAQKHAVCELLEKEKESYQQQAEVCFKYIVHTAHLSQHFSSRALTFVYFTFKTLVNPIPCYARDPPPTAGFGGTKTLNPKP